MAGGLIRPFLARTRDRLRAWGLWEGRCAVCGAVLPGPDPGLMCPDCRAGFIPLPGAACPVCGKDLAPAGPALDCPACRVHPRPWTRLYVCGAYAEPLRGLILHYKFNQGMGLGGLLQHLLAGACRELAAAPPDLLAPVPLHWRRLVWRGYNQSLELARVLARILDRPLERRVLMRVRRTTPQLRLDRSLRRQNIQGAFRADPARVSGRRVLLVDDILTTGATAEECVRTLLAAGAARVDVAVLARA